MQDRLVTTGHDQCDQCCVGYLHSKADVEILQRMLDKSGLRLQISCLRRMGSNDQRQTLKKVKIQYDLSVIVYGSDKDAHRVGNYLQECRIYLQDPQDCDCNVPYANPHCLSSTGGEVVWTNSIQTSNCTEEIVHDLGGIFDKLSSDLYLEESESPKAIRTPLLR